MVSHWADANIDWAQSLGLFGSDMQGQDAAITRGDFVGALGRLVDAGLNAPEAHFRDVYPDDWFAPYINWATDSGIISGIKRQWFVPDSAITREQAAVVLYRYLQLRGFAFDAAPKTFVDSGDIGGFAKEAVHMLCGNGVISGRQDGRFFPKNAMSYGEFASLLRQLDGIISE